MASQAIKSPAAVEPEEVRQALSKLLSSRYFVHAPKKQGFLNLICDYYLQGRAHELNEYILAYDVFGRETSYDPSADTVVRVTAHEIRKKLDHYYSGEGANDPVRIVLPVGSYQPSFTRHDPSPGGVAADPAIHTSLPFDDALPHHEAQPVPRRSSLTTVGVVIAMVALTAAVVFLWISNRELSMKAGGVNPADNAASYGEVWAPFMKDSAPPLVILSNPPALRLSNPSDPDVVSSESIPLPPDAVEKLKRWLVTTPEVMVQESAGGAPGSREGGETKGVLKQSQTPRLFISTDVFTGTGEAIGLHYLTDLFRSAGRSILLKQSRTLSAEDVKNHNVIMLGGVWVNEWSGKLAETEDFVFSSNATLKNRNPQPGEEAEYVPQYDGRTGALMVDYALVTVKPNISEANLVMTLAGSRSQGTEAAAEFVTDKNYLSQLNQRLQQVRPQGLPPRFYQVLLKVGVENGIPTTISILALHELKPAGR